MNNAQLAHELSKILKKDGPFVNERFIKDLKHTDCEIFRQLQEDEIKNIIVKLAKLIED